MSLIIIYNTTYHSDIILELTIDYLKVSFLYYIVIQICAKLCRMLEKSQEKLRIFWTKNPHLQHNQNLCGFVLLYDAFVRNQIDVEQ